MEKLKKILWTWYYFIGWVLHELSHLIFLGIAWYLSGGDVSFTSMKVIIKLDYLSGILNFISKGTIYNTKLVLMVLYAPIWVCIILGVILALIRAEYFLLYSFYTITSRWHKLSKIDNEGVTSNKSLIKELRQNKIIYESRKNSPETRFKDTFTF